MRRSIMLMMTISLMVIFASPEISSAFSNQMTLAQLADQADLIFVGTANDMQAFKNQEGAIITKITFSAETVLKGSDKLEGLSEVALNFAGGKIGETRLRVSDVPIIQFNKRYVLMVRYDGNEYASPVVGMSQGLFIVENEPATNRNLVLGLAGNFIEGIKDGKLIFGSKAVLKNNGLFISQQAADAPSNDQMPVSKNPENVQVIAQYPVTEHSTDPKKAMTLDQFLAALSKLIHAEGNK